MREGEEGEGDGSEVGNGYERRLSGGGTAGRDGDERGVRMKESGGVVPRFGKSIGERFSISA